MGCGGSKLKMSDSAKQFHSVITKKPSLTKFGYKSENMKNLLKQISSPVFGGSVLMPVAKKGHLRSKKNPLEADIASMNTEEIYNGGYYYLPNIKESKDSQEFLDIYLLTPHIKDADLARKIQMISDYNNNLLEEESMKKIASKKMTCKPTQKVVKNSITSKTEQKYIFWDEIKNGITGYARIYKYKNYQTI